MTKQFEIKRTNKGHIWTVNNVLQKNQSIKIIKTWNPVLKNTKTMSERHTYDQQIYNMKSNFIYDMCLEENTAIETATNQASSSILIQCWTTNIIHVGRKIIEFAKITWGKGY